MRLVDCDPAVHAAAIREIFNEVIATSTALYEYAPRSERDIADWFAAKARAPLPVIGAIADDGQLAGFASFGPFRHFPAYKYTVEHSVYVRQDLRARGVGALLLRELVARATARGCHVMVGVIDQSNAASLALHRRLGFEPAGVLREAGFKFGRWLDVAFWQLRLPTPVDPVDG